ncbi:MAG: sulfotransferase family 2 domain-containing protein [Deltaproteobacteria bacterium]|nr:sulfotransferase family 2 domain-containing protein [Deltaproteobacteria bacterium]
MRHNVAFIHMPKCGGTSLTEALCALYGPGRRTLLDSRASKRGADELGIGLLRFRRSLLAYELRRAGEGRLVAGHYPVDAEAVSEFGSRWRFVTVLRDPVERWISHYFYNRSLRDSPFHISADLGSYLDSGDARSLGCLYARHLLGIEGANLTDQQVEAAKRVLSSFALVGIAERLDDFAAEFGRKFGRSLEIGRKNVSPVSRRDRESEVSPEIRARIRDLCAPDLELYEQARSLARR